MERITWDECFIEMAKLISKRSPCKRLQVGCVLVKDLRPLSLSYNGYLPSAPHESIIEDNHEVAVTHGEMNGVANACKNGINLSGATAYITHYPCIHCFKILVASGIVKIIYIDDYKNSPHVETLAKHTNVSIKKYSNSTMN